DNLDGYLLKENLLERKLADLSVPNPGQLIRASGLLPAGIAGDICYAQLDRDVEAFFKQLQPYKPKNFDPPVSFDLRVGDFLIAGHFSRITPDGLLFTGRPPSSQKIFCAPGWSTCFGAPSNAGKGPRRRWCSGQNRFGILLQSPNRCLFWSSS